MNPLSNVFIKMGDTGVAKQFARTNTPGDWQTFQVSLTPPYDPEPFPSTANIRYIITPSDRYSASLNKDRAFPVGGIGWEATAPNSFIISARNSDTAATTPDGNEASFFWLAIAENVTRTAINNKGRVTSVPLNQTFIGQPANFVATQTTGDHQVLPIFFCPAQGNVPPPLQFAQNGSYSLMGTFGTAPFPTAPNEIQNRPLIFATANNVGCGVSPYLPTHNAAAVALAVDQVPGGAQQIVPSGFNLIARNSDLAGACGFNWVALLQLFGTRAGPDVPVLPPGAQKPVDLMVDTGQVGPTPQQISFTNAGTQGDWFSAEVQFSMPFGIEPVVLITPQFYQPYFGNPPNTNRSSCAPLGMVQNVTRVGFTLAAHNTDTNNVGGQASFYWVAFGPAA